MQKRGQLYNAMDEASVASLHANATCASPQNQYHHNPTNIARRSMSIFSRRGVDLPEPTIFIPVGTVRNPQQMSEKQRSWLLRRGCNRSEAKSPKSGRLKSSRGTILHAVPQASIARLSALEEEMARSPNEEILSAISEHAPALHALMSPSPPTCSGQQQSPPATIQRKITRRQDASSRIGVWVDGVVHWNESHTGTPSTASDMSSPDPARPVASETNAGAQRPYLTVLIPNKELRSCDAIYQPRPYRPLSSAMYIQPSLTPPNRPNAPFQKRSSASRISGSSTSSSSIEEEASVCSKRSSATSIEAPFIFERRDRHSFVHRYACVTENKLTAEYTNRATSPSGPPMPTRASPGPPVKQNRPLQSAGCSTDLKESFGEIASGPIHSNEAASPTWSQAEHDLQRELSTTTEDRASIRSALDRTASQIGRSIQRSGSVHEVMHPPSRAPTIPKRSRKRDWRTRIAYPATELQRRQSEMHQRVSDFDRSTTTLRKSVSVSCSANTVSVMPVPSQFVPQPPERSKRRPVSEISINGSIVASMQRNGTISREAMLAAMRSPVVAEDVLLHILSRLGSPRDLFNTAIINKGMYRVYKENEIHLLRTAVYNESPASWELREWSPPGRYRASPGNTQPHPEHTPRSYMWCYDRDVNVIERLKRLILQTCQSFLRRETVFALSTPTHPNASRYNDAFWRIWSFCAIFGCTKNREDDITGQMDWLRGGVLANNEDCIASADPNMEFDMTSVLISPPTCFAEGNKGGLTASQLFDMTEIWNCMIVLLQSYCGYVGQARYYGVFDQCEVEEGDLENEEAVLEEWTAYLLTLGPSVVLEMAQLCPAAGLAMAKENGWTRWTPPIYNGSRTSFLKEPLAKSYQEQVAVTKIQLQDPREQSRKDASRRRVATLAAEIRLRRQSSAYHRSPLIDMSSERAMSMSSRRDSVSPTRSTCSRATSRRASAAPLSMFSAQQAFRPSVEDHLDDVRHWNGAGLAKDSSERAIQQLVAMGFERKMAIDALRITDRGDGLRPDRAIDLLIRQQEL